MNTAIIDSDDFNRAADGLIAVGRFLFDRGWVPATSGNFSARLADGNLALTVSGRHKGRLTRDDILVTDKDGRSLDHRQPSAETPLHVELYKSNADIGCVLHPHTVSSTVLSRIAGASITLAGYELLKAFPGIDTHQSTLNVPIFSNDQDTRRLARSVAVYMERQSQLAAYIIREHGFYTWGKDVDAALRHVEALEFLLACELELRKIGQ